MDTELKNSLTLLIIKEMLAKKESFYISLANWQIYYSMLARE